MYQASRLQLRAGMAMRGSEADQQTELVGSSTNTAFFDPDPLPLQFSALLTLMRRRGRMESVVCLCDHCHRVPVIFLFRHHGSDASGHLLASAIATTM